MTTQKELREFALVLRNEVRDRAHQDPILGVFPQRVFTQMMVDDLCGIGELAGGEALHSEKSVNKKIARVNGYFADEDGTHLDLFITIFPKSDAELTLSRADVERALNECWRYFEGAISGTIAAGDEGHEDYDMFSRIRDVGPTLERLRIYLFSDRGVPKDEPYALPSKLGTFKRTIEFWDLERLFRTRKSGRTHDPITVDFKKVMNEPLPCLPVSAPGVDYAAYLAVMPGKVLADLYDEYGERLLEMNVRSFLQARGKVNSGIRDTLLNAPGQFFAFNNGLTAIAEEVVLTKSNPPAIAELRGLQIVNGGQTTASIHRALKKDHADLSSVRVQMKLTVVPSDMVEEMVPLISKNANSQNKVNDPDFSANHPWHRRVEELSKTVWTPKRDSRWFYERIRGQYQVAKNVAADAKAFERSCPPKQLFTKTDLATAENTWDQLPQIVSLGGQKNFLRFTENNATEHSEENTTAFGEAEYHELISRLMLFRQTQDVVRSLNFPAYRANIVTYSLAYLVYRRGNRIDLERIWKEQTIPEPINESLRNIAKKVAVGLKKSAGDRNVTEWCKKDACWEFVQSIKIELPERFWADGPRPPGRATGAVKAVSRK